MLVWKEIIRPGTYWHTDDTGAPRKFVATEEGVRHFHDAGNKMLEAGLSIPVPVEHQASATPLTASQKAANQLLNNSGWVKKYQLDGTKLMGLLDIQDKDVYDKLPKTIRYTSPYINSFTDGDGRKWDGVISHVALTSRPRITKQEPFPSVATALSLASTEVTPASIPPAGVTLSRAGLLQKNKKGSLMPRYPAAFSLWAGGVKMAVEAPEAPPKEKEKVKDEMLEKKEEEVKEDEELPDLDDDTMTLHDILREVAYGIWGIELPEDTDETNLGRNLLHALMEQFKMQNGNGDHMDQDLNAKKTPSPLIQESPPFYMSLEQVNAITDPEKKAMAAAMLSMQNQTKALTKHALDKAKQTRDQRIERLSKRLKPASRDQLLNMAKGISLSMGEDGTVTDPLSVTLDIMESSVVDLPVMLTRPVVENPHPVETGAEMNEERRKQIVEQWSKAGGLKDPNAVPA